MEDLVIKCPCGQEFTISTGEQEWFESKMMHTPSHCPSCRKSRKETKRSAPRQMYETTCATCGAVCSVPFQPKEGGTYYCRQHYIPGKQFIKE